MDFELPKGRFFQLQLSDSCSLKCSFCPGLGLVSDQPTHRTGGNQFFQRIRQTGYTHVLIPCSSILDQHIEIVVERVLNAGLVPVAQFNSRQLNKLEVFLDEAPLSKIGIQIIHGTNHALPDSLLNELKNHCQFIYVTIVAHKRMHALEAFRSLTPQIKQNVNFHFPLKEQETDEYYSSEEIYDLIKRFRLQFPEYKFNAAPGIDLFQQNSDLQAQRNLYRKPLFSQGEITDCESPKFSIIIPLVNDHPHLFKTLESLEKQIKDDHLSFEVIIADAFCSPQFLKNQTDFIRTNLPHMSLKWVKNNLLKSTMSPGTLLASLKNICIPSTHGEYLLFFNAQSFVEQNFLLETLKNHETLDVVQHKNLFVAKTEVNGETALPENNFWSQFYQSSKSWSNWPDAWRYFSTQSLSMRKTDFINIGMFRNNFASFGFEDSDLGYRIQKSNLKFGLGDSVTSTELSSQSTNWLKKKSFQKNQEYSLNSKIFFQNNLDPILFEQLKSFF